ncbi:MAG: PKD domain-containing protein, partial [Bacteroidota bacterium]
GDGNTGGASYVPYTYNAPGTYDVTLTISTNDGCVDSITRTVTVTECQEPINCYADFSYFQNPGCEVDFTDMSTVDDSIVSWSWDFGDGHTASGANPTYTFAQNGTYPVRLIIRTASGCTDSVQQDVILDLCGSQEPCAVAIGMTQDSINHLTYHFQDQSIGHIQQWKWEFGDGHSSSEQHPSHTYDQAGPYVVSLAVGGDSLCTASDSVQLMISTLVEDGILRHPVQLYPNPTTGSFMVQAQFTDPITVSWELLDLRGKVIQKVVMNKASSEFREQVDIQKLAHGVYIFQLMTEEGILYRSKVAKQ